MAGDAHVVDDGAQQRRPYLTTHRGTRGRMEHLETPTRLGWKGRRLVRYLAHGSAPWCSALVSVLRGSGGDKGGFVPCTTHQSPLVTLSSLLAARFAARIFLSKCLEQGESNTRAVVLLVGRGTVLVSTAEDAWRSDMVQSAERLPAAAVVVQTMGTYAASASSPLPPSAACCAPAVALPPACTAAVTSQGAIARVFSLPSNAAKGYAECMESARSRSLWPTYAAIACTALVFNYASAAPLWPVTSRLQLPPLAPVPRSSKNP